MKLHDVIKRVKEIRDSLPDYEKAHSLEDQLYLEVLQEAAKGNPEAYALARAALKSKKLDFERYSA